MSNTQSPADAARNMNTRTENGGSENSIGAEAADNLDAVKRDMEHLVDRASEEAEKLSSAAKEYGAAFAQRRKAGTADTISDIAQNLRELSDKMSDRPNLLSIMENAADSLEDVADGIRTRSFSDLYDDAEAFARARPLTVAAGAAVVGLLAARFLKSSSARANEIRRDRDWDDYDPAYPYNGRPGR